MEINITKTKLPSVLIVEPKVYGDERGYFMELYHTKKYRRAGIEAPFVQDNLSVSKRGCLRGLHYQFPNSQGKLVWVLQGSVFDVVVDIRQGSPTFGHWVGTEISDKNKRQVWVPPGFAHGFCVTSESAAFLYKCTDFYAPQQEHSILWNDPTLNIKWPVESPTLSPKDQNGQLLGDVDPADLPRY